MTVFVMAGKVLLGSRYEQNTHRRTPQVRHPKEGNSMGSNPWEGNSNEGNPKECNPKEGTLR